MRSRLVVIHSILRLPWLILPVLLKQDGAPLMWQNEEKPKLTFYLHDFPTRLWWMLNKDLTSDTISPLPCLNLKSLDEFFWKCVWMHMVESEGRNRDFSRDIACSHPPKKRKIWKWVSGSHYLSMALFGETGQKHHTKEEHSIILSCLKLAIQLWILGRPNLQPMQCVLFYLLKQ